MVAKDVQLQQDAPRLPSNFTGPTVLHFAYMGVHSLTAAYAVDQANSSPRPVHTLLPDIGNSNQHQYGSMRLRIDPPEEKEQLDENLNQDEVMPQANENAVAVPTAHQDESAPWILTVGTEPSSAPTVPLSADTPASAGSWSITLDTNPIKPPRASVRASNNLLQYRVSGAARRRRPRPVRMEFKTIVGVPVGQLDAAKVAAARDFAIQKGSLLFRQHRAMFTGQLVRKLRQSNPSFQIAEPPRQLSVDAPPACAVELIRCDTARTAVANSFAAHGALPIRVC